MTAASPSRAAAPAPTNDAPVTMRLANGLTVLVKKDSRFPLVSLRLYVHAGSAYESPEDAGISHVLEHMVFKGTDNRPKGQIARDVEGAGGYLNAATSFDYTVYKTDMTREHWKTGLDALKDMAFHPTLDPEELEAEKEVIVAELKRGEDLPSQRLFRMVQQAALKGTPYSHPIIGYEKTIRDVTRESMRAYISRYYQPQSMLLLICGDVDPQEALQEAANNFGDLSNSKSVVPPVATTPESMKNSTVIVEESPWKKAHIALAFPVAGMPDTRASQLDVLAQLLGGDVSSRFYRTYKYEKRLVDAISVSNYSFERLGLLFIQVSLDADKVGPFWESFSKDLANLDKMTFSKEELERAKFNIEDSLLRSKETLAGSATKLGYFSFFSNGAQGEENYLRSVRECDTTILRNLIKDYCKPEALSLIALLPQNSDLPKGAEQKEKNAADVWSDWLTTRLNAVWKSPTADGKTTAQAEGNGKTELLDLGNGRTLVLIPDNTLPYTAVNLLFHGGDSLLSEKNQGIAAFTASLLTKGTTKLSATAIEDYLADRAASFSANTGRQSFSVNMNFPARFSKDMFDLLHATLVTPALKEDEAARVRENQLAAITSSEDSPTSLAFRRMFPFLLGNHPYGFLQLGEKDLVAKFVAKDAREFWREQTLQPWVLAVSGVYDKNAILAAIKKLPVPGKDAPEVALPEWGKDRELSLRLENRKQAHLFMVFPTIGTGNEDEAGLDLLQNILAGQSGLLFRDLRDKQGLGYSVTAIPWKTQKTGALIFYIGTEPDKMQQAEEGFRAVIKNLHEQTLPEEELDRGKNQMQGDYYRGHQTLASRSSEASVLTVLGQPLDAASALVDKARHVDAQALQTLAQKYLQQDKAYIVKVLP